MKIHLHDQAAQFLRALPPEPKRALRLAFRRLPRGDGKLLQGRLAGYWQLRSGGYRAIYPFRGPNQIPVLFIEHRNVVYEIFEALLAEKIFAKG